jgi:hypothetical protein
MKRLRGSTLYYFHSNLTFMCYAYALQTRLFHLNDSLKHQYDQVDNISSSHLVLLCFWT